LFAVSFIVGSSSNVCAYIVYHNLFIVNTFFAVCGSFLFFSAVKHIIPALSIPAYTPPRAVPAGTGGRQRARIAAGWLLTVSQTVICDTQI
jgi:quinol-cytochrome oxidoreductase complex cytochrome b subunit